MGALIAKLLSFFGFRTVAVTESADEQADDMPMPDNSEFDNPGEDEDQAEMPTIPDKDEPTSRKSSIGSNAARGSKQSLKGLPSNPETQAIIAKVDFCLVCAVGLRSATDHAMEKAMSQSMLVRRRSSAGSTTGYTLVKIQWIGEAQTVYVTGTWLDWKEKVELHKNANSESLWEAEVEFPVDEGDTHELKFIVDDLWKTSDDMQTRVNDQGTLNNVVHLSENENH